jgi:hypothetical protein
MALVVKTAGWAGLHDEFARWTAGKYGVSRGSDLDAVLDLQTALMPAAGKNFPHEVHLRHDVVRYYGDRKSGIAKPLVGYPRASVRVTDPLKFSDDTVRRHPYYSAVSWELESPLRAIRASSLALSDSASR